MKKKSTQKRVLQYFYLVDFQAKFCLKIDTGDLIKMYQNIFWYFDKFSNLTIFFIKISTNIFSILKFFFGLKNINLYWKKINRKMTIFWYFSRYLEIYCFLSKNEKNRKFHIEIVWWCFSIFLNYIKNISFLIEKLLWFRSKSRERPELSYFDKNWSKITQNIIQVSFQKAPQHDMSYRSVYQSILTLLW